jgi:hypothetical protein
MRPLRALADQWAAHGCPDLMVTGIGALVVGVAFTLLALAVNSATVFFAGTTRSGVGFGRSFQAAPAP